MLASEVHQGARRSVHRRSAARTAGWYSVSDTDVSTVAVIAEHADAMSHLDCRRGTDAAW
jgi:hypothetical protein